MRLNEFATGMSAGDVAVVAQPPAVKQKVKRDKKGCPWSPNAKMQTELLKMH